MERQSKSNQNNMRDKIWQKNVRKLITKNVNKHNMYILFKGETQRPLRRLWPWFERETDKMEVQARAPAGEVAKSCKNILVFSTQQTYIVMHSEGITAKLLWAKPWTQTKFATLRCIMMFMVFTNFIKNCYYVLIKTIYFRTHFVFLTLESFF